MSPLTGETMHLCAQCMEAYDMGFTHGQVPADQIVPPKEEEEDGTHQGSPGQEAPEEQQED